MAVVATLRSYFRKRVSTFQSYTLKYYQKKKKKKEKRLTPEIGFKIKQEGIWVGALEETRLAKSHQLWKLMMGP